jgi:hypothetical protein
VNAPNFHADIPKELSNKCVTNVDGFSDFLPPKGCLCIEKVDLEVCMGHDLKWN